MRARIWGARGSLATPGPETLRFGGNTSCVEVRLEDGTLIILDAGTGIRGLGLSLVDGPPSTVHLCLTHLHLDHIEGLGFFTPLWLAETDLHVWGPPSPLRDLRERIARYFSPPLFPMQLSDVPARMTFHDVPADEWSIGTARLCAQSVSHPGPTVGYRLEEGGRSIAYIPDHEPALGNRLEWLSPDWISGFRIADRASVLLHDAQYTEEEYAAKTGWGHSSVNDAVAFAQVASVERLVLFHHDPLHADGDLDRLERLARELWSGNGSGPELAYEGMDLEP
ncbi:MAG: MBL fold metallo-hydrolase [Gaiellaceae bacterium]